MYLFSSENDIFKPPNILEAFPTGQCDLTNSNSVGSMVKTSAVQSLCRDLLDHIGEGGLYLPGTMGGRAHEGRRAVNLYWNSK